MCFIIHILGVIITSMWGAPSNQAYVARYNSKQWPKMTCSIKSFHKNNFGDKVIIMLQEIWFKFKTQFFYKNYFGDEIMIMFQEFDSNSKYAIFDRAPHICILVSTVLGFWSRHCAAPDEMVVFLSCTTAKQCSGPAVIALFSGTDCQNTLLAHQLMFSYLYFTSGQKPFCSIVICQVQSKNWFSEEVLHKLYVRLWLFAFLTFLYLNVWNGHQIFMGIQ